MIKTVFISSTYLDLKEERKKVWETLEKFDVIVKGMEQFGARRTNPLETCLTEVEQSDIYVGIIGMRYGSEEPKTSKSYSQLEYEKAIKLNIDILIYIIDEENSLINPSLIQYDKINKLNSFKSILKEHHTVDTFSNAQDLISKLQRKFTEKFTKKKEAIIENEYENTIKILDLFFLMPAIYSGREIKLKVIFSAKPNPVSKNFCKNFEFEFGKTIVSKIKVIYPKFEFKNFNYIIIENKQIEEFLALDKTKEYEIYAKVLFKDEKVKKLTTDFRDITERVYYESYFEQVDDHYIPESTEYYDVLKVGDGQIALLLRDIKVK